jgi:predicted ATP-dependent serine protease
VNGLAAWGEIGLTGELRAVSQSERRGKEAARLDVAELLSPGDPAIRRLPEALAAAGLTRGRISVVS